MYLIQRYKWREQFVRTVPLYLFISFISTKNCDCQSPSSCLSSCSVHKQISIYNNSSLYTGLFFRVWYAEDNVRLTTAWVTTMCLMSLGWSVRRYSGKDVDTDCGGSWFISRICSRLQYLDWGFWGLRLVPQRRAYVITNHATTSAFQISTYWTVHSTHLCTCYIAPSTEANSSSATQEIPRSLWKKNVHYSAHNSPLFALKWVSVFGEMISGVLKCVSDVSEILSGKVKVK